MFSLWYASLARKQLFRWVTTVKWLFMNCYWCNVLRHVKPTSWWSLLSLRVRIIAESISAWNLAYEKDVVIQFWQTTHKLVETPPRLIQSHCFHTRLFCFKVFLKITKPTDIYLNLLKLNVSLYVPLFLTLKNSTFCPQICFVCVSEKKKKMHRSFTYTTLNDWLL